MYGAVGGGSRRLILVGIVKAGLAMKDYSQNSDLLHCTVRKIQSVQHPGYIGEDLFDLIGNRYAF